MIWIRIDCMRIRITKLISNHLQRVKKFFFLQISRDYLLFFRFKLKKYNFLEKKTIFLIKPFFLHFIPLHPDPHSKMDPEWMRIHIAGLFMFLIFLLFFMHFLLSTRTIFSSTDLNYYSPNLITIYLFIYSAIIPSFIHCLTH